MATTNLERVGKALEMLTKGLRPFVERELEAVYGSGWIEKAVEVVADENVRRDLQAKNPHWDASNLLIVMWQTWSEVFKRVLGHAERSLVSELREIRNKWAHQKAFSTDDTYRALDSVHRLLQAVSAPEATDIEQQKQELLRVRFEEQARKEVRKATIAPSAGQPTAGLKSWRQIVTPHPDVASGRYQAAEFAADLGQVHRGEPTGEYQDPSEFFRRTYLTEGLKQLLARGLERVTGAGGDPVVELQTNFGGGKTHTLLAFYHLFSGVPLNSLPGIEPVLQVAKVDKVPKVRRVVLVGRDISPGQPRKKADGTVVRTLWGELAWQLGGKEGFALVAEDDKRATNPGEALRDLLRKYAPCLILIDEWVVYARGLYKVEGLPGGTLETHLSFAQAISEAAKGTPGVLLIVSIPASDIEIGGDGGQFALEGIKKVIERVSAPWRPASAEESFEIVRRRLFLPLTEKEKFRERDAVIKAFVELYKSQPEEFPRETRDPQYERRLQAAYPIHPELFDRLYEDWSALEKFQRTRGVLRLMAAVIHALWERQDGNLLIMPSTVALDDPRVQYELTTYLEDNWVPVIEADVDGPNSLPLRLDRENPSLGRFSAARRVARTVYLGSAPTLRTANRGIEDRGIKLGCAQPGESPAVFGDALRRLTDQATHLYVDGQRYWFDTQPSVTRTAQQLAEQLKEEEVDKEIEKRLEDTGPREGFSAVHDCPEGPGEVPDEPPEARLVILGPSHPHTSKDGESPARHFAKAVLEAKANGPRMYRNALVFLAPDKARLVDLRQAVRQFMAWERIEAEKDERNLNAFQVKQASTKRGDANNAVKARIPETFCWLLAPEQLKPDSDVEWREIRLQGTETLAARASRKLRNEERLIVEFAGTRLRFELDRIPLWRGDHVKLKQLIEDFFQYLYLPRLKDADVLIQAVRNGLTLLTWESDSFAYAEGFDEKSKRYKGLQAGRVVKVSADKESVIVKPEVAAKLLEIKAGEAPFGGAPADAATKDSARVPEGAKGAVRFYGTVKLDPTRVGRDAGKIAEEVVQHLTGLVGSDVEVHLEIHAERPDGYPENVVRTVTENAKTLRFKEHGFEDH